MTRDCFDPGLTFVLLGSPAVFCEGFAAGSGAADDAADRFFAGFDIEILRRFMTAFAPYHRSPTSAMKPAGQDL